MYVVTQREALFDFCVLPPCLTHTVPGKLLAPFGDWHCRSDQCISIIIITPAMTDLSPRLEMGHRHLQQVLEVIQDEGLLALVKVMCDWMTCQAAIITACAQVSCGEV